VLESRESAWEWGTILKILILFLNLNKFFYIFLNLNYFNIFLNEK